MTTHRVTYGPEAEARLDELHDYIAAEASPEIARRHLAAIVEKCESLADFPRRGTPRDDLRPGLRTIVFRRRVMIAYDIEGDVVTILEVLAAGQDIAVLLREE